MRRSARSLALVLLACLLLVVVAPAVAGAMTVTQASTRPNGSSGTNTYGTIPTRLTWQAKVAAGDPAVTAVQIKLPSGTNLKKATFEVITLAGLTRTAVTTTPKISGETIEVPFAPPLDSATNVRVTVKDVVFPAKGGTFQLDSFAVTAAGTVPVKSEADPITITPMTPPERIIFWLNQQRWVAAWNSVTVLQMFLNPQIMVASFSVLWKGWLISLMLVFFGFPVAIPFGLMLAFAKMSKIHPLRWFSAFYVNVIRGTPLFLQMYIAFFGLPLLGINPNKYLLGIVVLALNSSAYLTEIFRAGIQSIHKGQFEAASSLGMNYWQSMQYVIIPQTVKRVLPTMTSEFILLYKDTAMLAAVGVFELMMYAKNLSAISGNVTPYIVAAMFYLVVTTPLIRYVQTLEHKLAIAEGGATAADKPKKKNAEQNLKDTLAVQDVG